MRGSLNSIMVTFFMSSFDLSFALIFSIISSFNGLMVGFSGSESRIDLGFAFLEASEVRLLTDVSLLFREPDAFLVGVSKESLNLR